MAGFLSRLTRWFRGDSPGRGGRGRLRATYDAADDRKENQRHWAKADALSAASLNTPEVRETLRNRARYEVRNNSYASGLLSTIAFDLIGTGPRLQLNLPDSAKARAIERAFATWARQICLAEKLRILHESRLRDGECFAVLKTNLGLPGPVKLDLQPIEADQCVSPWSKTFNTPGLIDGIEFDADGNRTRYHFRKHHPGDWWGWSLDTQPVDAKAVIHWYRPNRPGQVRGVSELTPALNLFAYLRRYTEAVIVNAETAARITGIMETDLPADSGETPTGTTFDEIELPRGALLTMPSGWRPNPFQAGQPHQKYEAFKESILNEIGRTLNAPFNVVAGNSSKYNYSSGRLDHLIYHRSLWVDRERLREIGLDRVVAAWLDEAVITSELTAIFEGLPPFAIWNFDWQWDGFESIDPVKDAQAEQMELANNTNTLAEICAAKGRHWEDVLAQRAREQERIKELELSATPPPTPAPAEEDDADPESDEPVIVEPAEVASA